MRCSFLAPLSGPTRVVCRGRHSYNVFEELSSWLHSSLLGFMVNSWLGCKKRSSWASSPATRPSSEARLAVRKASRCKDWAAWPCWRRSMRTSERHSGKKVRKSIKKSDDLGARTGSRRPWAIWKKPRSCWRMRPISLGSPGPLALWILES